MIKEEQFKDYLELLDFPEDTEEVEDKGFPYEEEDYE